MLSACKTATYADRAESPAKLRGPSTATRGIRTARNPSAKADIASSSREFIRLGGDGIAAAARLAGSCLSE